MERGNENSRVGIRSMSIRGVLSTESEGAGNGNRRALRDIKNFVAAPPQNCAAHKKGQQDKMPVAHPQVAGSRPMTRRFVASLANKSQNCSQANANQEANAKPKPIGSDRRKRGSIQSTTQCSNAIEQPSKVIDVDDLDPVNELSLSDEVADMVDGVEIIDDDIEMEPVPDIDSVDAKDPLAVVKYVKDIHDFYRKSEASGCVCPNYMASQFDINEKMRAILVDWLIEVHYKFELMDETLYLMVNIVDRFLERESVVRKKLQLVGVTAMLLSCKYEEVSVPIVEDLITISDRAYSRDEVLQMEKSIVNALSFKFSAPTSYAFIRRFLKAANSDKKTELLAFYLLELCLVEYQMLKFQPSLLAAAAVYTAQCTLMGFKYWSVASIGHTQYSEDQLMDCSMMMVNIHRNAGAGKLTGVHRKYCMVKYGCIAKIAPALFLL